MTLLCRHLRLYSQELWMVVSGCNLFMKLVKASSKSFRFNYRNVVYSIEEK